VTPEYSFTYKGIVDFIQDFEACRLPKARWTHEAHLTAGFWYLDKHAPSEAMDVIRGRIQRHNESVGTANTDDSGYHETITRLYLWGIDQHRARHRDLPFEESLALLLASPLGESAWPLRYYSRDRLFSVAARRGWVEPDLQPQSVPLDTPPGAAYPSPH
jgi:hypothetical protein